MPQFAPLEQEEPGEGHRIRKEGAWNWKFTLLWVVIAGVVLILIFDRQVSQGLFGLCVTDMESKRTQAGKQV
jgi:hypothetical protein